MSDRTRLGFAHHHTDEELRAWMAVPAERKIRWLAEALEMTRQMLPADRRCVWLAMRGEEPGASIPIESLEAAWPSFVRALDAGAETSDVGVAPLLALAEGWRADGRTRAEVRETLLALREWAPFRAAPRAGDTALVDEALRRLGAPGAAAHGEGAR
jgi:hypothetical protein